MFSVKRVKNLIVKDFVSSSKIVLTITVGLIFLELLQLVVPYLRYSSYSHLDVVWRSGLFNVSKRLFQKKLLQKNKSNKE